jgi:hypothetical protein
MGKVAMPSLLLPYLLAMPSINQTNRRIIRAYYGMKMMNIEKTAGQKYGNEIRNTK